MPENMPEAVNKKTPEHPFALGSQESFKNYYTTSACKHRCHQA